MAKKKQRDEAGPETGRAFPFALLIPLLAMLVLGVGSAGTVAGVRARRREQEREGLPALLAMVPAAALAIAGLLGVAAIRRRRDHSPLLLDDTTPDLPASLDA